MTLSKLKKSVKRVQDYLSDTLIKKKKFLSYSNNVGIYINKKWKKYIGRVKNFNIKNIFSLTKKKK